MQSILDFGCGTGRVIRNVEGKAAASRLVGVDIDESAIRWCRRHFQGVTFDTIDPEPPLPFGDRAFDFIFAVSVFTHLDEALQFRWLRELSRVLRPGGIFVASVHGDHHRAGGKRCFDMTRGFAFTRVHGRFLKNDGLPAFYQDAQHTRGYIEREWSRFFTVLGYEERGMADHQDAVVMTTKERQAQPGATDNPDPAT
jgi:SAM-dependent methyltransferase